jgi:hypothetical protein
MRSLRSLLCLAALAAGVTACSLGLDFGPEGQPCDARNQCLAGYACQAGSCVSSDSPSDAGTSPTDGGLGSDGGTTGNALREGADHSPESY